MRAVIGWCLLLLSTPLLASTATCDSGWVFEDRNGNGLRDADEPGLAGVQVSDGRQIVRTDSHGSYRLAFAPGRTHFVIKPAGFLLPRRADGLPDFWQHVQPLPGPTLRYGGIAAAPVSCRDFPLIRHAATASPLEVLVFGDPQPKTAKDIDYYRRDIVIPILEQAGAVPVASLGLTLGDVVNDELSLYPAMNQITTQLDVPWLHAAGNHDLDFDATTDADSLLSFRATYGPDTVIWEESAANFVVLDNVIYLPGQRPEYIGGLREEQFELLAAYLAGADRSRLLVLAMHIPLFNTLAASGQQSFRAEDRTRLFALLADFPQVLVLSAHGHTQQHYFHSDRDGWLGARPLHEYNVGATCGAYWSGAMDAAGIPDSTMSDGTPNGYARLHIAEDAAYTLRWHVARDTSGDSGIGLHAPRQLRRGAYPAYGVYANVFMGHAGSVVEYRIDDGPWQAMRRVAGPDPRLLVENMLDDLAEQPRGHDRSPEAAASAHLWRGTLATDLPAGEHRVHVRAFDDWRGELRAETRYRLYVEPPVSAAH